MRDTRTFMRLGTLHLLIAIGFLSSQCQLLQAQKQGLASIREGDLRPHMEFLASGEVEGRATGETGGSAAARYLEVQARSLGLREAVAGQGLFQEYALASRSYDMKKSRIRIETTTGEETDLQLPFYSLTGLGRDSVHVEGDFVFAGYGIHDEANGYLDLAGVDVKDKIVLIMDGGPTSEDGTSGLLPGREWGNLQVSLQTKLPGLMQLGPKAVLLVPGPKSGAQDLDDLVPGMADAMSHSYSFPDRTPMGLPIPPVLFVHRKVADAILATAGKDLAELQQAIDRDLTPRSFVLEGKRGSVDLIVKQEALETANVFGILPGSDPEWSQEIILYVAHYDHLGTNASGEVFFGADDNASGSVALLEVAGAFLAEKRAPARSVGFLWVSGEEIGLFGSRYFADHPLVPLERIAAVINLDMVGRSKTPEDEQSDRDELTISGKDTVKVLGGLQSEILMEINREALKELGLVGNYTYNDLSLPGQFFYRSDHINFARKDIPVLFYSTGTHADYHRVTDRPDRIDYDVFVRMCKLAYLSGYKATGFAGEIIVDNPMSGW
ncbi:MAG: M28 family peptidase [Bacteroidales bacterium]